jgi:hypothetical protein
MSAAGGFTDESFDPDVLKAARLQILSAVLDLEAREEEEPEAGIGPPDDLDFEEAARELCRSGWVQELEVGEGGEIFVLPSFVFNTEPMGACMRHSRQLRLMVAAAPRRSWPDVPPGVHTPRVRPRGSGRRSRRASRASPARPDRPRPDDDPELAPPRRGSRWLLPVRYVTSVPVLPDGLRGAFVASCVLCECHDPKRPRGRVCDCGGPYRTVQRVARPGSAFWWRVACEQHWGLIDPFVDGLMSSNRGPVPDHAAEGASGGRSKRVIRGVEGREDYKQPRRPWANLNEELAAAFPDGGFLVVKAGATGRPKGRPAKRRDVDRLRPLLAGGLPIGRSPAARKRRDELAVTVAGLLAAGYSGQAVAAALGCGLMSVYRLRDREVGKNSPKRGESFFWAGVLAKPSKPSVPYRPAQKYPASWPTDAAYERWAWPDIYLVEHWNGFKTFL